LIRAIRENLAHVTIKYKRTETQIRREAFAPDTGTSQNRPALPASKSIQLQIAAVSSVCSLLRFHCFAELAAVACGSPK
jgi:hypothetical protein